MARQFLPGRKVPNIRGLLGDRQSIEHFFKASPRRGEFRLHKGHEPLGTENGYVVRLRRFQFKQGLQLFRRGAQGLQLGLRQALRRIGLKQRKVDALNQLRDVRRNRRDTELGDFSALGIQGLVQTLPVQHGNAGCGDVHILRRYRQHHASFIGDAKGTPFQEHSPRCKEWLKRRRTGHPILSCRNGLNHRSQSTHLLNIGLEHVLVYPGPVQRHAQKQGLPVARVCVIVRRQRHMCLHIQPRWIRIHGKSDVLSHNVKGVVLKERHGPRSCNGKCLHYD